VQRQEMENNVRFLVSGSRSKNNRILKAVSNNEDLAFDIVKALGNNQVERVLSKIDVNGK